MGDFDHRPRDDAGPFGRMVAGRESDPHAQRKRPAMTYDLVVIGSGPGGMLSRFVRRNLA